MSIQVGRRNFKHCHHRCNLTVCCFEFVKIERADKKKNVLVHYDVYDINNILCSDGIKRDDSITDDDVDDDNGDYRDFVLMETQTKRRVTRHIQCVLFCQI